MTTKIIYTRRGQEIAVSEEDYEELNKYRWFIDTSGYVARGIREDGIIRRVYMHRQVMAAPKGIGVDHINGDKVNNSRVNLRLANQKQNMANTSTFVSNSLEIKGVIQIGKRFAANIKNKSKQQYLGMYDTQEEASEVYQLAHVLVHREFSPYFNNHPVMERT